MLEDFIRFFTRFDLTVLTEKLLSLLDFSTYTVFTWIAFALIGIGMTLSLVFWLNRDIRNRLNLGGALSFFFTIINGLLLLLAIDGKLFENTCLSLVPFVLWIIVYIAVIRDIEYIGPFLALPACVWFGFMLLFSFFAPACSFAEEIRLISSQAHILTGFLVPYAILITDIAENGLYPKNPRRYGRKRSRLADAHYTKKRRAARTASSRTAKNSKPSSSRTSSYSSSGSSYSSYDSGYKDVNASRAELQNRFVHGRLSLAEKERLAKEHNDKYFDAVRVDENGLYQNVYGHPDDFKQDLSQD